MEDLNRIEYGYTISDRYIIRKALGKGGSGEVFLAYDNKLCRMWAIKRCNRYTKREIDSLKRIDHHAFPRIVDVISQDGTDFIVMDYIEGQTLDKYLKKHVLSEQMILRLSRRIAEAIDYLHNQNPCMLYMDCKPENIIVTESKDIRLVDLGSVYICDDEVKNVISGTRFYAPEEVKEIGLHKTIKPDVRSDIYSFGMTLYHMLTGSKIEYRDRKGRLCIRRMNKNISKLAERIVRRCTAKRMQDRYMNFSDALVDIKQASSGGLSSAIAKVKGVIGLYVLRMVDITCKCLLSFSVLINANRYRDVGGEGNLINIFISIVLFLILSRKTPIYSMENKKDVFKGAGAKVLLSILIFLCAISAIKTSALANSYVTVDESTDMYVDLYDQYNRKILIKSDAVWEVDDDIFLSIPIEELSVDGCKITISCSDENGQKSYSFLCKSLVQYNE